jgi:hypothetical protein
MNLRKYNTAVKILFVGFLLSISSLSYAQGTDSALSDLEFTEISPDTPVISKEKASAIVKATDTTVHEVKNATNLKTTGSEKDKTLWETFYCGFTWRFSCLPDALHIPDGSANGKLLH